MDWVGKRIDKYQVEALLGEGGMGTVYLAYDPSLLRKVALKMMHPHLAKKPEFQRRFMQEAQVAANLGDHASIVTIFEFDHKEDLLYMVMEFVSGGTLSEHIRQARQQKRAIELREVLRILAQVADALDYAHRRGAIHRDIKPSNILLKPLAVPDREGDPPIRAVVTDFGLAKLLEGGVETRTGAFMGSLSYMSPQQCLDEDLDGRSDIYSLGVVLYQLTTGQLPFDIKSPTDAVTKHQRETPLLPCEVRPGLPLVIQEIILKAIAKQPDDRLQTASSMAVALRQAAHSLTDEAVTQYAPPESVMSLTTQLQRGEPVPEPSRAELEPHERPAGDHLVMARKGEGPRGIALDKAVLTIGRGPGNDVVIEDRKASRQHARIDFDGSSYRIVDLNSTNGTYLGDAKLLPGIAEVWTPDKPVRIGDTVLRLVRAPKREATVVLPDGTVVKGRVGIYMKETQLRVEPGSSTAIPVVVFNQGPEVEHFTVTVDGIPDEWWESSPADIQLMPGQEQEVSLTFHPPRSPQSRAGPHPITVIAASGEETAEEQRTLTVGAYSQFHSALHPQRVQAGAMARVTVENQGNSEEIFALDWQDRAAELAFQPPQAQLTVPEGQEAASEFRALPRQRRWIGGDKVHPITAQVRSAQGEAQTHSGEVVGKGLIPVWLPPVVVALLALLLWKGPEISNLFGGERQPTEVAWTVSPPTAVPPTEPPPTAVPPTEPPPTAVPPTEPPPTVVPPTELPPTAPPPVPTIPALVLDDFEDYGDSSALQAAYNINAAWDQNVGVLRLAWPPNVGSGTRGAAFDYQITQVSPDDYAGFERETRPQDWRPYNSFCAWVKSAGSSMDLVIQFREVGGEAWRYQERLSALDGDLLLPLDESTFQWADWSDWDNGRIDLNAIYYYGLFVGHGGLGSGTIYIDNIRLTP